MTHVYPKFSLQRNWSRSVRFAYKSTNHLRSNQTSHLDSIDEGPTFADHVKGRGAGEFIFLLFCIFYVSCLVGLVWELIFKDERLMMQAA